MTELFERHFLFLQGPHGPFFRQLAKMLQKTGATTSRIGFNAGDEVFWCSQENYLGYQKDHSNWEHFLTDYLEKEGVTDIVVYGDTREIHATALATAKQHNIRTHVFEEGYMRPYWVTYERGGTNGFSKLATTEVAEMRSILAQSDSDTETPPAHWGDMRQHVFYSAIYHWFLLAFQRRYQMYQGHRETPLIAEAAAYTKRLLLMPYLAIHRWQETARIRSGGYPYHVVLLQLEHDASFTHHSSFAGNEDFIDLTMQCFAEGAPKHHHLVFKAHPLEAERIPLRRIINSLARSYGVSDRVHYVRGGKLAQILDYAKSAVTVNSTAAQQALWRGLPLKTFGASVYSKPEFTSSQALPDFFANPTPPDTEAYKTYRRYLLSTCQVPGGFYSRKGRQQLLRVVVDMMLSASDPYEALSKTEFRARHPLRVAK